MNFDRFHNMRTTSLSDSSGDPFTDSGRGGFLTWQGTLAIVGCLLIVAGFVWLFIPRA